MFKRILLVVVVLIGALLAYAATRPDSVSYTHLTLPTSDLV